LIRVVKIIINFEIMTIINSEEELDLITKEWEMDISIWNTYTFKEVYNHLYSKKNEKEYV